MSTTATLYECPKCYFVSHNPNDAANFYCVRCHQFADDMRDEEVTDFKAFTDMKLTRKDCFTLALLTLTPNDNPDLRLLHGWVTSSFTGESIQHVCSEPPPVAPYYDASE